jgi:hypothetical protein
MLQIVLRGLVAGFIVVAVSEIAARFPRLGALILTIPVVPAAVLALVYLKANDLAAATNLARQMLVLIPLGLLIFVPVAMAERLHLSFWTALGAGLAMATAGIAIYLRIASRGD